MSQNAMIFSGSPAGDIEFLTGDVGGPVGADAGLNINLFTDEFLTTTGIPGTNTITISLDGILTDTGTTIGAVTDDLASVALGAGATTYILEAKVVGFEATTPASCGYNIIAIVRTNGAAATIVGVQDKYNNEEAALLGCDANFVAVGNTISMRVLGTAGLTIDWRATTSYIREI